MHLPTLSRFFFGRSYLLETQDEVALPMTLIFFLDFLKMLQITRPFPSIYCNENDELQISSFIDKHKAANVSSVLLFCRFVYV